jgi:hypothetical protein
LKKVKKFIQQAVWIRHTGDQSKVGRFLI